jgi:hypothetical protein
MPHGVLAGRRTLLLLPVRLNYVDPAESMKRGCHKFVEPGPRQLPATLVVVPRRDCSLAAAKPFGAIWNFRETSSEAFSRASSPKNNGHLLLIPGSPSFGFAHRASLWSTLYCIVLLAYEAVAREGRRRRGRREVNRAALKPAAACPAPSQPCGAIRRLSRQFVSPRVPLGA